MPLIVNVMGSTRERRATLVEAFGERDEVAALELNVSCPNVKTGLTSAPTRARPRRCSTPSAADRASR